MSMKSLVAKTLLFSLVLSVFPGLGLTAEAANPIANLVNNTAMINPEVNLSANAGLPGDVLTFSLPETTTATVTFSGASAVNATVISGPATKFSVTVPNGAISGPVTIHSASGTTYDAGSFQVWKSRGEPYVMPVGHLNVTLDDLKFILDQIKMAEAHSARTATTLSNLSVGTTKATITYPYDVTSKDRCFEAQDLARAASFGSTGLANQYIWTAEDPLGLRQVDGQCNNISNVSAEPSAKTASNGDTAAFGASDEIFTRLTNRATGSGNSFRAAYDVPTASVSDPTPRVISNLISDQTTANPAAVAAANNATEVLYGVNGYTTEWTINATTGVAAQVLNIPNITADYNVSAGYNSWFTLFGQFFDHGLDLIPKAGAAVLIPLQNDDPLYSNSTGAPNMMVLTRAADQSGESINTTTPWVDQSQTYGSHPSQNFFLREYSITGSGSVTIKSTGRLLDNSSHGSGKPVGMATWKSIKDQARTLGFNLTDYDAEAIPVIATDQYGKFIPGSHGYPLMLFYSKTAKLYSWIEGNNSGIGTGRNGIDPLNGLASVKDWQAVDSGHAFINDTAASAVPYAGGQCGPSAGQRLTPDADSIMNNAQAAPSCTTYDNELFEAHLVAGDGRINENIGLSAVHNVFHSEHNLLVQDIQDLILKNPLVSAAFKSEWVDSSSNWNGERLYQAARFINEMEYQHMVYDEFVRRIAPELPVFLTYNPNENAQITAEFASAVYRLGHSMLNETIARSNPGNYYDPANNQDVSLITAFTNPVQVLMARPAIISSASYGAGAITYTLQNGETAPKAGSVVTISNLSSTAFNVENAVVFSANATSFIVKTAYSGSASPTSLNSSNFASVTSTTSKQTTDSLTGAHTNYATVIVSDPMTNGFDYTPMEAAAAIAQGMSSQRGNEIDEFVTDGVRNNLLGLPLDLASLNIARGRDVGVPSLNDFRRANSSSLTPYTSWFDYIVNGLRHRESGLNFIAAYGQDPSILSAQTVQEKRDAALAITTRAIPAFITGASSDGTYITFTAENTYSKGQTVTISGISGTGNSGCNIANALIDSADVSTFTIKSNISCGPNYKSPSATTSGSGGRVTYVASPGLDSTATSNAIEFVNSTGAWSTKETGLNYVDLWIGGLAENPNKQPIIPPMLGSTFQYVFKDQMQKLQDSDRFYYLSRLIGINLFAEVPAQKLTDIVRRNTESAFSTNSVTNKGIVGINSPGFSQADCAQNTGTNVVPNSLVCKSTITSLAPFNLANTDLTNIVLFTDPTLSTGTKIQGGGGDDSIQGGPGNDLLSGGIGGDLMTGGAGDDILLGGAGEDIINGNSGNDTINAGESQLGDIADGGSGSDFIHCGNCSGVVLGFNGESGNDFVQGGKASDLGIFGGEGDDWIEAGAGLDIINGDSGPFANVNLGGISQYSGGADVINPGTGLDLAQGDGGDDIFLLGIGQATPDGGFGFDWSDNEYATRYDNGPLTKPNVWADLGGNINPNTARTGDTLVNVEAVSGSAGNDMLFGGTGRMPITVTASGIAGQNIITISGAANAQILAGSYVTGSSNSTSYFLPNTIVTDIPMAMTNCGAGNGVGGGSNCMTFHLSSTIVKTFLNASILITIDPLTAPSQITGLDQLIANTQGTSQTGITSAAWSGGAIMLGGQGNDSIFPSDGSDVIHGSAYLHVCIQVSGNLSSAVTNSMDVPCGSGRGFSNMSLLAPFMDAGTISVGQLSIVREIRSTAVSVTSYSTTTATITYNAANNFVVGDKVTVTGLPTGFNVNNAVITLQSPTSFTISKVFTSAITNTPQTPGIAVATDTLDLSGGVTAGQGQAPQPLGGLSGAQNQFTLKKFSGALPLGATYGCTIKDKTSGNLITVFDIELITYTDRANVDISSQCGPAASAATLVVPTQPAAPRASFQNSRVSVSWNAPTSDGNSPIDSYVIKAYDASNVLIADFTGTCSSIFSMIANNAGVLPSLTCDATDLPANQPVTFTVTAHNLIGDSLESNKSTSITPGNTNTREIVVSTNPSTTAVANQVFAIQPSIQIVGLSNSNILVTARLSNLGKFIATPTPTLTKTATTDANGVATFSGMGITTAGTFTITYSITYSVGRRSNSISVTSLVTVSQDLSGLYKLAITNQPSASATSGLVLAMQPSVQFQDKNNANVAIANEIVTATLSSGTFSTGLNTATALTDLNGLATFSGLQINNAGTYTIAFSSGVLPSLNSQNIVVGANSASKLALSTSGTIVAVAGSSFGTAPSIQLKDSNDVAVKAAGIMVTATLNSGTFSSGLYNLGVRTQTAVTNVDGIATFNGLQINTPGTYTLTFSSGSLTTTTASVTVSTGSATKLVVYTSSSLTGTSNTSFAIQPAIQLQDDAGNSVATSGIVVTAKLLNGLFKSGVDTATATTNVDGLATFTNLGALSGGNYNIIFTSGALTSVTISGIVIDGSAPNSGSGSGSGSGGSSSSGDVTISASPSATNGSYSVLTSVTLAVNLVGTTRYTLDSSSSTSCSLRGNNLSASAAGTCKVIATITGTTTKTGTISVSFVRADQTLLRISNTILTSKIPATLKVKLSGGSGSGGITYYVTGSGCSVDTTGNVSASAATTCSVTATKAATSLFNAITSTAVTFTFTN